MKTSPALRKAAILVDTLSPAAADALLDQMPAAQADRVRQAVMDLDDVSPQERRQVVDEFLHRGGPRPKRPSAGEYDGVELDARLADRLAAPQEPRPRPEEQSPFDFLAQADDAALASLLEGEHPQLAAVVLSQLPPVRAAAVLRRLPEPLRSEALRRVASLAPIDPAALEELAAELRGRLAAPTARSLAREEGRAAAEQILKVLDPAARQQILEQLGWTDWPSEGEASEPAARGGERPEAPSEEWTDSWRAASLPASEGETTGASDLPVIAFEDFELLSDAALARVLREAPPDVALLALAGASPSLASRIFGRLSPRQARELNRQIESIAPVRLRDVDAAQQVLARLASRLVIEEWIEMPPAARAAA